MAENKEEFNIFRLVKFLIEMETGNQVSDENLEENLLKLLLKKQFGNDVKIYNSYISYAEHCKSVVIYIDYKGVAVKLSFGVDHEEINLVTKSVLQDKNEKLEVVNELVPFCDALMDRPHLIKADVIKDLKEYIKKGDYELAKAIKWQGDTQKASELVKKLYTHSMKNKSFPHFSCCREGENEYTRWGYRNVEYNKEYGDKNIEDLTRDLKRTECILKHNKELHNLMTEVIC